MTTILFGAGASRRFFDPDLSTQYLTDQVKDKTNWDRVLSQYSKAKNTGVSIPESQCVCYIINEICAINPDYNFEQIGELLDKFCSHTWDPMPKNTYLSAILCLFCKMKKQNIFPGSAEFGIVPFLFRQIIAEAILNLKQVPTFEDQLNQQTRFINYIKEKDQEVNLVSLNYDDLVISSALNLGFETGFLDQGILGKILNVPTFFNAKQVVYFPHGHVRYKFTDQTNVEYFDSASTANSERWNGVSGLSIGSTAKMTLSKFAYNFNTFLTTGQTKDDSLNLPPYAYFYQRLAKDLFASNRIILIGYSFGDEHINRLLQSFLQVENSHKLIIVDWYQDPILLTNEYMDQGNIVMKIYNTFHTIWEMEVDPNTGQHYPINPNQVQQINNIGYGNIFDRVLFYKKGYLEFLKEYKNVI